MLAVIDATPERRKELPGFQVGLRGISHADTRAGALAAIETCKKKYGVEYERGVNCPTKDTEVLPAFQDFPAEHRDQTRRSNPMESVSATVRHRTVRSKGALSPKTAKLMVFTPVRAASKTRRKLNGTNRSRVRAVVLTIEGVKFTVPVAHRDPTESRAA